MTPPETHHNPHRLPPSQCRLWQLCEVFFRTNQTFEIWGSRLLVSLAILFFSGCGTRQLPDGADRAASGVSAAPQQEVVASRKTGTGFVGSAACQKCHADAFEAFHHHPMSESLEDTLTASQIEEFDHAEFSIPPGLTYYVDRTPEGVFHHEKRIDASGELIYDQGVKVAFAVGSGRRGRSYLINESGRLYASPVTWYSLDQKWGLSPGYVPEANLRFDRRVSDGCVFCHAGQTQTQGQDLNRFADDPFPERSIGCERCHGPGSDHIAYRGTIAAADTVDPIFNPARVNDARRDAVCNQCHLQGRRRVVLSGRTEFDFQAGMTLSENWVVFLKTSRGQTDEAAAISQVEQMYSSRCYREADGQLGCITCHSGHAPPTESAAGDFFREKCLHCHSSGKTECSESPTVRQSVAAADSCIACHMPRFPASNVHATQTDHRIPRRPGQPASEPRKGDRLRDLNPSIFEEPGVQILKAERNRARGVILAERAADGRNEALAQEAIELLLPAIRQSPGDIEGQFFLGKALEVANQSDLAARAWQQTLGLQPTHEEALEALATLFHRKGNLKLARYYYERLIEVNPQRPNYYGRLAHVLGQLGELPRGIELAEKCLSLNPSLFQTHAWLVEAYRRAGNEVEAARHEAKLKQFQSVKSRIGGNSPSGVGK